MVNDPTGTAYNTFQQYADYDRSSFTVGGKTGTASNQLGLEPNSWFVGFGGPGDGSDPSYVVVCVIDQGGYGASAAAPVVAQVFNYLATNPVAPVVFPTATNPPSSTTPVTNPPAGAITPGLTCRRRPPRPRRLRASSRLGRARCWERRRLWAMTSLFEQIEPLLFYVERPARYVGGEGGSASPVHAEGVTSWLLAYPDTYEIGLPNQGLQILYEILNERADALAERTYAPWTDMEAAMRAAAVPLFSVENHVAACDFDALAFNLSAELTYTNVLNMLDLGRIPLRTIERGIADTVVLAGGHCTYNPEPLAEFLDAVVLGDGEEVVSEISMVIGAWLARPIGLVSSSTRRWLASRGSTSRASTDRSSTALARWASRSWTRPPPRSSRREPSLTWVNGPTPCTSSSRSPRWSTIG